MRILPRLPLYTAAVAFATASTVLLTTAPASAAITGITPSPEPAPCETSQEEGKDLTAKAWATDFIGTEQAHQYNEGQFSNGDPVRIAVIDSGVQANLDDLFGDRVQEGFDVWDEGAVGQCDSFGHGTAVAAIAAGNEVGDGQFVGVAPKAEIVPIRIFESNEPADETKTALLAESIRAAVDDGADVINISIAALDSDDLESAVDYATENNVVIVAATGNDGANVDEADDIEPQKQTFYPAAYEDVIAVGANNPSGGWYEKTNYGEHLDLLAPGDLVSMPTALGQWIDGSGTSFAAPHVAGAAALLKGEYGEDATVEEITNQLRDTAIPPPNDFNIYQGYGVLNVEAALSVPLNEEAPGDQTAPPAGDGERQAIDGFDPNYDPLATANTVAWSSVGAALIIITLVLVLRKIIPSGRRRGWRPGTRNRDRVKAQATAEETT